MADHMVDLSAKLSRDGEVPEERKEPFYPLTLYLDKDEIKKLKLTGALLSTEHILTALVRVTHLSASEQEGKDTFESMTLSLIEGEIDKPPTRDQAKSLFGSKD